MIAWMIVAMILAAYPNTNDILRIGADASAWTVETPGAVVRITPRLPRVFVNGVEQTNMVGVTAASNIWAEINRKALP